MRGLGTRVGVKYDELSSEAVSGGYSRLNSNSRATKNIEWYFLSMKNRTPNI